MHDFAVNLSAGFTVDFLTTKYRVRKEQSQNHTEAQGQPSWHEPPHGIFE